MVVSNLALVSTEDLVTELESRSVACAGSFFVVGQNGHTDQYDTMSGDVCLRIGISQWLEACINKEALESFPSTIEFDVDDDDDDEGDDYE